MRANHLSVAGRQRFWSALLIQAAKTARLRHLLAILGLALGAAPAAYAFPAASCVSTVVGWGSRGE